MPVILYTVIHFDDSHIQDLMFYLNTVRKTVHERDRPVRRSALTPNIGRERKRRRKASIIRAIADDSYPKTVAEPNRTRLAWGTAPHSSASHTRTPLLRTELLAFDPHPVVINS